jgi:hypothetical protein
VVVVKSAGWAVHRFSTCPLVCRQHLPCCGSIVQLNDMHFILPEISSKRSSCLRNHNIMTYSPQEILERTCEATLHPQQLTIPSGPHFRLTRDGLLITNQQCGLPVLRNFHKMARKREIMDLRLLGLFSISMFSCRTFRITNQINIPRRESSASGLFVRGMMHQTRTCHFMLAIL